MTELINEGAHFLVRYGTTLVPFEYTGYRDEILASKDSAYLGTALMTSPVYDIKGPDAAKFLTSCAVNDFSTAKIGGIRHAIFCNEKGQILTDGVVMKLAEDHFRTYWCKPAVDYYASITDMDVEGIDMTGKEFFFQVAGPKSLEVFEEVTGQDLSGLKFCHHTLVNIAGVECRLLRLGMAGSLAYEIHGDVDKTDVVYGPIWEAVKKRGGRKLGKVAYCMNHTEGGFPNINLHYPLPWMETPGLAEYLADKPKEAFNNINRCLIGSLGDDLEDRFRTPYDVGWGGLVKFNHEFPGRAALEKIAENPPKQVVTLEWNAEDVADVYADQLRGADCKGYKLIDENPVDVYYNLKNYGGGIVYNQDKVLDADGNMIGVSAGRLNSYYYHRMISLGFIDPAYASCGTEVKVVWGDAGKPQKEIRATVARYPYADIENNKFADTSKK